MCGASIFYVGNKLRNSNNTRDRRPVSDLSFEYLRAVDRLQMHLPHFKTSSYNIFHRRCSLQQCSGRHWIL